MSYPLGPDPESLFAAWLDRLVGGEDPDIDELCREHLEAATALRALHAHWVQLEAVVRQCCMGRSLADKLRAHFGGEVDPQVTLEHESAPRSDFTREVLSRLGGRGPAATRYRIQGEVAHGGMGAVLRVWDLDLRRHLAMKVMLAKTRARPDEDPTPTEERFLARFLEEAQVTAQLDHPGIVPVHELGLDAQGHVYFTMKLVKGQTLKEVLDDVAGGRGHWKPQRVLGVLLKVCEAMSYAHDKGVIHRDLKPANVMVGRYGEVYVMDWGLAKIRGRADDKDIHIRGRTDDASTIVSSERSELSGESSLCTMEGDVVGTPAYMPPEQALGRVAEMGPASDVYALGAMLYHLLAGHMPYVPAGARPNNYAVWRQVQSGPPRALEHEAPQAPAEVVAICKRAMARSPSARYADMTALASDLAAYLDCRVVYAYEAGAWAEARKWVRRNRPLAASLAAALLLAVGGSASTAWVQARGRAAERVQKERADAEAAAAHANMLLAQGSEAQSKAQQVRAEQQQSRAEQSERQANEERAKVLRLSDVRAVHQLLGESDRLWPPHPVRIDEIRKWVESAGALVGRLPMHRETLDELRSHARPWNAEERRKERQSDPRVQQLEDMQTELSGLVFSLEQDVTGAAEAAAEARVVELESKIATLNLELEQRRSWVFDTQATQWQFEVLSELVRGAESIERDLLAEDAVRPRLGWSMPKRIAFAETLRAGFAEGGSYSAAWAEALPAIRSAYPGLDLAPQMGLLPIGPDPDSHLWEFAHLMSGTPARRGTDGRLALNDEVGFVLVLLPGGTFWMGAQARDPTFHNYDPNVDFDEGPVHLTELSPFFLSKYELTQGQWLRLTGDNPSFFRPGALDERLRVLGETPTLLHPLEQVSWDDCATWLPRLGLALPSEAQWEFGYRAGTGTPWWTGNEKESLAGVANLLDRFAHKHASTFWIGVEEWLDDGAGFQQRIGSYRPNAFGLHDVAGNVEEWCLDGYDWSFHARAPRLNPVSAGDVGDERVFRGGHYAYSALVARASTRSNLNKSSALPTIGVRPARALER